MSSQVNWLYKRVYDGVNYRLRTVAGGRFASHCRPTSILVLLTELCNARCIHCDIWKNKGREESPTLEQWKTVMSDLRAWLGPVHVVFTGGEALLKPFTSDLVAHASAAGLFLEVLTHGYWDDQSKIERLAMAKPWKVTISLDGIGETHTKVRGRDKFFEKTTTSIETFRRVRREQGFDYLVRVKNVLMEHNLDDACEVARYGNHEGMEVFYQPIEQNYNTPEDERWFTTSPNWPKDTEKAVSVVRQLIELKKQGYRIANSMEQLEVMIPYFRDPDAYRLSTQGHIAHEHKPLCSSLNLMQLQANGNVTTCLAMPPVGNVKQAPIREIWENRPRWWEGECCLSRRCSDAEKEKLALVSIG